MIQFAEYLLTAALVFVIVALVMNLVVVSAGRRAPNRRGAKKLATVSAGASSEAETEVSAEAGDPEVADDPELAEIAEIEAEMEGIEVMVDESLSADAIDTANGSDADIDAESADAEVAEAPVRTRKASKPLNVGSFATGFAVIAFLLLTAYLIIRMVITGHGPFANQHEFAVSFVWGILGANLIAQWRFKIRMLSLIVLPVAGCLLLYAIQIGAEVQPLVPALQNNLLLTLHVGFAILSYGAACVSFAAAILYLLYPKLHMKISRDRLDELGYKGAVIAFPLMTIMILLGALWANTAWGSYWSWDPKETAALVTWLLYAGFLHARVARGWRGKKSAWLLIIGFAAVMFAYFGNYFFGGLHSYA